MNKLTEEQRNKIKELHEEGKSSQKIANEMGLSKPTVYYWIGDREKIKKNNIERYRKKSKEEKKVYYERQKEYQKEYHRNKYNNDPIFREKVKERAREYKRGKKKCIKE